MQTNHFVGEIRHILAIDAGREVSNPGLQENFWGVRMK